MTYLWSLVLVAVGLVLAGLLIGVALGPVKRFAVVSSAMRDEVTDKGGMLAARVAALRVRLAERRNPDAAG